MNNTIKRDVQYLHKNLSDKKQLQGNELDKFIMYDLYLKHPNEKTVVNNITESIKQPEPIIQTVIQKEYNDILPKLQEYEKQKELYKKDKNKEVLLESTRVMLREIIDLLTELHKNCDIQEERDLFKKAFGIINSI